MDMALKGREQLMLCKLLLRSRVVGQQLQHAVGHFSTHPDKLWNQFLQ